METSVDIHTPAPAPYARITAWLSTGQLLPWLVFAVSLLVTQQLWKDARQTTMKELQAEFDFGVREAGIRIRQRMAAHEQVLRGVHGLFGASIHVDRSEFKTYVSHLQLDESYAGIDGIGFSQIVPLAEKNKHVDAVRKEGFPDYIINPAGNRGVYAPAVYIEPFSGRNLRIFGFDTYAKPEHRAAMELARDSDKAAITGKVNLGQGADSSAKASIVMYMPVYRNGASYASRADRRSNIVGWVFAPFSMSSLMSGILGNHSRDFDIEIYDGKKILGEALMSDDDAISIFKKPGVLFKTAFSLDIAGRNWAIVVSSHPAFEAHMNKGKPQLIASIGISASLLLTLFTWLLVRARMRAIRAAQGLEWELAARKKLQATLRESEERWRFALEGGGEGVWDWNIQTGETLYSRRWKEILCFYEDEAQGSPDDQGSPDEWIDRVHPEDQPSAMASLQAHFDRKTAAADCEFRMLCHGGKWKWVHCRGMVVSRDAYDKPLRFVGTIADITERRAHEDEIRSNSSVETLRPLIGSGQVFPTLHQLGKSLRHLSKV